MIFATRKNLIAQKVVLNIQGDKMYQELNLSNNFSDVSLSNKNRHKWANSCHVVMSLHLIQI